MRRLWMEIMPSGYHVYSDEQWLLDIYDRGGPDFSVMAQFDVFGPGTGGKPQRLNPKYIIRCWVVEYESS